MCRLISISVNYMLSKQYTSYTIIQERQVSLWLNTVCKTHVLSPCQHDTFYSQVQYHTLVLMGDSSHISSN